MSWLKFHREQLTVSLSFQGCLSRYAWVDCLNGQHQISLFFIDVGAISFLITPSIPFPDIFTSVIFEDKYGKEKGKTNKHTRQSNTGGLSPERQRCIIQVDGAPAANTVPCSRICNHAIPDIPRWHMNAHLWSLGCSDKKMTAKLTAATAPSVSEGSHPS